MIIICLFIANCNTSKHDVNKTGKNENIKSHSLIKEVKTLDFADSMKRSALVKESEFPDSIHVQFEGKHYVLYNNGKIEIIRNDSIVSTFHLNTDWIVEKVFFYSFKNNLIVFFSDTDHDAGASIIECFEKPDYKSKWTNPIGGFNLSDPIINNNFCYISSIGFVAKINLDNGEFVWKHDDLYDTSGISSFKDIEFHDGNVHFIEGLLINESKKPNKIIVNDESGKVEEIIKNVP